MQQSELMKVIESCDVYVFLFSFGSYLYYLSLSPLYSILFYFIIVFPFYSSSAVFSHSLALSLIPILFRIIGRAVFPLC